MAIRDEEDLDERLSRPTAALVEAMGRLDGDVAVLGAGGKMGPSLARMAKRASGEAGVDREVIAVSRFSSAAAEEALRRANVRTVRCDLLDSEQVKRLPDAAHVVYMPGMKFGTTGNESLTWAMNTVLPTHVCERYAGSRIVAFSTGNVYPFTRVVEGGAREEDPRSPLGEYGMSALGRERVLEHHARTSGIPTGVVRLNYAVELRYGVLVDLARKVLEGEPVDLSMGSVNVIWQGDANAMALRCLEHAAVPPFVVNVTGPETLSVRRVAETFGRLTGRSPRLEGEEAATALLGNAERAAELFGYPTVPVRTVMRWVADWLSVGGRTLDKPTHFESRNGAF